MTHAHSCLDHLLSVQREPQKKLHCAHFCMAQAFFFSSSSSSGRFLERARRSLLMLLTSPFFFPPSLPPSLPFPPLPNMCTTLPVSAPAFPSSPSLRVCMGKLERGLDKGWHQPGAGFFLLPFSTGFVNVAEFFSREKGRNPPEIGPRQVETGPTASRTTRAGSRRSPMRRIPMTSIMNVAGSFFSAYTLIGAACRQWRLRMRRQFYWFWCGLFATLTLYARFRQSKSVPRRSLQAGITSEKLNFVTSVERKLDFEHSSSSGNSNNNNNNNVGPKSRRCDGFMASPTGIRAIFQCSLEDNL